MTSTAVQPVKDILTKANDVYVLLGKNPNLDSVASALGLYLALKTTNKNIYIGCPQDIPAEFSRLIAIDKITQEIGNRNLVISLKVDSKESIDKVSYNLSEDGKTFNLVVQPKSGTDPLKTEDVTFAYSGADGELVILMGIGNPEDCGHFYTEEKKLFQNAQTVSLTRFPVSGGTAFNFNDPQSSSLAEITLEFIHELGFATINEDVATNLLSGIDASTNQLQHPMLQAETFETVAELLKSGGIRQISNPSATAFSKPMPNPTPKNLPTPVIKGESQNEVPQDWLAPKIYKSPRK